MKKITRDANNKIKGTQGKKQYGNKKGKNYKRAHELLQIFTTSENLQKSNIFGNNKKQNRKKKYEIFSFF